MSPLGERKLPPEDPRNISPGVASVKLSHITVPELVSRKGDGIIMIGLDAGVVLSYAYINTHMHTHKQKFMVRKIHYN